MYLIVTRAFPPELGGMQSLMWGLTKEMSKNFMIKVFADYQENHKEFDKKENYQPFPYTINCIQRMKMLHRFGCFSSHPFVNSWFAIQIFSKRFPLRLHFFRNKIQ